MAATQESLELVPSTAMNAVEIFTKGGLGSILDGIEAKVRAIPLDGSTAAGREQIRSVAYSVVRTKTLLDTEGKALTEDWRKATGKVNEDRKKLTERLTALAEEVRKPLTDYENKEKARVAAHEEALKELGGLLAILRATGLDAAPASLLEEHLSDFGEVHAGRDWEEFSSRAKDLRRETSEAMVAKIEARKKHEAEQAELARLRAEEAERLQRERDERLQKEAAEKQRLESERKAAQEAEAERKRVEAAAEKVRIENERARREQERAVQKAEAEKLAAEAKAKADVEAAEKRARDAAEAERNRIESERKAKEAADAKRAADKAHIAKIRAEILQDLAPSYESGNADDLVNRLIDNQIRHVRVIY